MSPDETQIRRRSLPDDVLEARVHAAQALRTNAEILEPMIDAHLSAFDAALIELADAHAVVGDQTDLDLVGDTGPGATWTLCGRNISMAIAAASLLRSGFAVDAIPTLRSLHEGNRLLDALCSRRRDDLLAQWLAGKWVKHKDALAACEAAEGKMREEMVRDGIAPPRATKDDMRRIYGPLSEVSHNRRRHIRGAVSAELRQMPLGPHPDLRIRGVLVGFAGNFMLELITVGGFSLSLILGREWFVDRFDPTFHALRDLRRTIPLNPESLRADTF